MLAWDGRQQQEKPKDQGRFYEVQVTSVHGLNHVFCRKDKMPLSPERDVAFVLFEDGAAPSLFLIPSLAWQKPDALLVDREYKGMRSKPEWGINLSRKNLPLLNASGFPAVRSDEHGYDRPIEGNVRRTRGGDRPDSCNETVAPPTECSPSGRPRASPSGASYSCSAGCGRHGRTKDMERRPLRSRRRW